MWKIHHSLNSLSPEIVCSWSCQLHLPGPGQTVRALTGLPNNPTQATGRALSHRGSYIDYVITFGDLRDPPKLLSAHVFCMCICVCVGCWKGGAVFLMGKAATAYLSFLSPLANISNSVHLFFYPLYLSNPQLRMIAFLPRSNFGYGQKTSA